MKTILYAYNNLGDGASKLAASLGIKKVSHLRDKPVKNKLVINWGCSSLPRPVLDGFIVNMPEAVAKACNKLETFKAIKEAGWDEDIPEYTTEPQEAVKWLPKGIVVCRTKLSGHSGEGIVLAEKEEDVVKAPLYVKYIPKKRELRIHVNENGVFFVQEKKRNTDVPDDKVNWKIRNHGNGFIYANQDVEVPEVAREMALRAIIALDLSFGAVDMIYNEKNDKWYVLEVNTAPGLHGTTLEKYTEMFSTYQEAVCA